jgi:hypothetical protein
MTVLDESKCRDDVVMFVTIELKMVDVLRLSRRRAGRGWGQSSFPAKSE